MTTARTRSAAGPRQATLDDLLTKAARKSTYPILLPEGEDGEMQVTLQLTSLGATGYDKLLAEHPPTKEQKDQGDTYNGDTFGPALIAAVVSVPKLTIEQMTDIWNGETWSRGELRDLFLECVNLCNKGLNIPFKPAG